MDKQCKVTTTVPLGSIFENTGKPSKTGLPVLSFLQSLALVDSGIDLPDSRDPEARVGPEA